MHLSLLDMWNQMSWFPRGIVFVMVIMSVWSLGIAMNKWWKIRVAQKETRKFAPEFSRFLQEEQMEGAINLATKYKKSHVARTLVGALEEIKPLLTDNQINVADINSAERAIERNLMFIQADLKRGLGVLATVGALVVRGPAGLYAAGQTDGPTAAQHLWLRQLVFLVVGAVAATVAFASIICDRAAPMAACAPWNRARSSSSVCSAIAFFGASTSERARRRYAACSTACR